MQATGWTQLVSDDEVRADAGSGESLNADFAYNGPPTRLPHEYSDTVNLYTPNPWKLTKPAASITPAPPTPPSPTGPNTGPGSPPTSANLYRNPAVPCRDRPVGTELLCSCRSGNAPNTYTNGIFFITYCSAAAATLGAQANASALPPTPAALKAKAPDISAVRRNTSMKQGRDRDRGPSRLGAARRRPILQPGEERLLRRRAFLPRCAELHGAVRDQRQSLLHRRGRRVERRPCDQAEQSARLRHA